MNHKNNRRVQMTRQLLQNSLLDMLQTQEIQKISIRTLCQHANVNRSTFYKYYGSQYDLLKEMVDNLLDQIEKELTPQCEVVTSSDRLVESLSYLKSHYDLCKLLINSNVDPEFPKRLLYLPSITNKFKQKFAKEDAVEMLYIRDFILYGGFQIIKRWLNSGCSESPETIAKIFDETLQKLLA
ncbi:TetR-like C-terminal domain-containing protein [Eubacteriaceae bacterium ES2]|nr:TetR-like C-terminal domain-containing protein [Eubacteriaceae bacterium ES2]